MSTAAPVRYRVRHQPGFAKPGKPTLRGAGDAPPPAYSGPYWYRSPAIVMRGWRPRAIEPANPTWWVWTRLLEIAAGGLGRIAAWQERARSREALLRLDDRSLDDIGLTRLDVRRLVNKTLWRGRGADGEQRDRRTKERVASRPSRHRAPAVMAADRQGRSAISVSFSQEFSRHDRV